MKTEKKEIATVLMMLINDGFTVKFDNDDHRFYADKEEKHLEVLTNWDGEDGLFIGEVSGHRTQDKWLAHPIDAMEYLNNKVASIDTAMDRVKDRIEGTVYIPDLEDND